MIAKNELTATLEIVRQVATENASDIDTILKCVLLGVLDEINTDLKELVGRVAGFTEQQGLHFGLTWSLCRRLLAEHEPGIELDDLDVDALEAAHSDRHDDLAGVLHKIAELGRRCQDIETTVERQDERLDGHYEVLQTLNEKLNHLGRAMLGKDWHWPPAGRPADKPEEGGGATNATSTP